MKLFAKRMVCFMCALVALFAFSACKEEEKDSSFDFYSAKSEVETADSYTRSYLNNLQVNNSSNETLSGYVTMAKDSFASALSILQTCNTLTSSFASLGEEDQDIKDSLVQSATKFSIVYENTDITIEHSEDKKYFSTKTENSSNFMLVEYAKLDEGKYACQIVIKDFAENCYDIMQLMFHGYSGSFVIDNGANTYASIYLADVESENFPMNNGDIKYSF